MTGEPTPRHPWNDPDKDGHNCVDCAPDSIWKCDRNAHPDSVLPPLTPIEGLDVGDPMDLLSPQDRARLQKNLDEMAAARRRSLPGEQLS